MRSVRVNLLFLSVMVMFVVTASPAYASQTLLSGRVTSIGGTKANGGWEYEHTTEAGIYRLDVSAKEHHLKGQKVDREIRVALGSCSGVYNDFVTFVGHMQETVSDRKAGTTETRNVFLFAIADVEGLVGAILPATPDNWPLFISFFKMHFMEWPDAIRAVISESEDLVIGRTTSVLWLSDE